MSFQGWLIARADLHIVSEYLFSNSTMKIQNIGTILPTPKKKYKNVKKFDYRYRRGIHANAQIKYALYKISAGNKKP